MYCVYMNNFRGFTRTVVPIRSVNFLVGENSTGKSSFLALSQLLMLYPFWFNFDFNIAESYEFGGYKDIVSAFSDDNTEFQVGECNVNKDQWENNIYYLMHFRKSKNGIPELFRFSLLGDQYFITIKILDKQPALALSTDFSICKDFQSPDCCFEFLQEISTSLSLDYKKLSDEETEFLRQKPIFFSLKTIISKYLVKKIKNNKSKLFMFPFILPFISLAPIRTTPKRTYDGYTKHFSPEGEHTPYVIRMQLPRKKSATNVFKEELEIFGKNSGLFETIGITQFGKDSTSPFELTVTLDTKTFRINSVGYGVSQVLPVIVELLLLNKNTWIAIQQPEVHLHPKAQAALGDVFFQVANKKSQTLLIETHSDYLLDRFRLNMRDNEHPKGFAQVIFFDRTESGNCIYPMIINEKGEYPEDQPPGFREFFLAEQKRILGI